MLSGFKNAGPAVFVTAAFIGPGTVTACTIAGVEFGYALIWGLVVAIIAAIVLQEMAARLGVVGQQGLGQTLADSLAGSLWKWPLILLVIAALYVGNSAYQAGNLTGAALGVAAVTGNNDSISLYAGLIALIAGAVFLRGSYRLIERFLVAVVLFMSFAFITTFIVVKPDISSLFKGAVVPLIPERGLSTLITLIGTTVVPYNLFLHSSAARTRWHRVDNLKAARADTIMSISIGGLVSILILSTAAASFFGSGTSIENASDMAYQLEPVFGGRAKYLLAAGLFAAGLSSAITAPMATAYAVSEILGLKSDTKSTAFRVIALSVLAVGSLSVLLDLRPLEIILFAQLANGLLLPIIALFLVLVMNRKSLLGEQANGWFANIIGLTVVVLTASLGLRMVTQAAGSFGQ
ncbi:MAG: Nramp family divalent metal transporter [Porticoccaceae bacterium]|nr:Nramp family divalent metal transporter [Porticoccaceae bacterium]